MKIKAEAFIKSYFEKIEKNSENLQQAIKDFLKEMKNFDSFEYLFSYEIALIYHYHFNDYENARKFYLDALNTSKNDIKIEGEIYFHLGELLNDMKLYKQSNEYLNLCLQVFSKNSDNDSLYYYNSSLRVIGLNWEDMGDYEKAISFYKKAVENSKETINSGIALHYLSALYHYKLKDEENALIYAKEAEQLITKKYYAISNYQLLSSIYLAQDDFKQAIIALNMILDKFPNFEEISDIYHNLGRVYCIWRKEEEGIKYFQEAYKKLSKDAKDYNINLINIKYWLAMAYEGKGELKTAFDLNNEIFEEYSFSKYNLILTLINQARVLQKKDEILEGYSFLKKGLNKYEKSPFYKKNNEYYIEALDLKNELLNKLPILNRLIEKYKN